ncbi:hypothetical protein QA648_28505 (plasmid) [Rhizobium sp. CB3171]|uniref:hypothetical protein n=1 Tax=unclassified Rhizobium TaxID=2613769 RepID=UPI000CDF3F84|nr:MULTISPECIES: hypothetical protein [Rhizobium]AVA26094.1 hypothetical protein NXC24_PC01667 [Rhizobium sp. NXC24]UWU23781.1 hypothetical protein N2601_26385 [Rhizobium tropici]WFU04710.1 hypothetical protein QA648_28505 [Rhizobium sp. CB3171]
MKKLMILVAITVATLSASASAGPVTTKGGYEYDRNQLSDATVLNWNIQACSHGGINPDAQQKLAKLMGVSEANVRLEFCRRVLTAYAKGAIPYEDYVQFVQGHLMAPSIMKALRIAGSAPLKPQSHGQGDIVLPVSAKMDSGETFKGSTIASREGGRFSVQSSRHSVKCSGTYDPKDRRPTVTLPVKCSDGRTGQAEVTRAPDLMSGWGKVKLSDGSAGRLVVGSVRKQP